VSNPPEYIDRLTPADLERLRDMLDDYLEDVRTGLVI
jgi:hypothetical protein